MALSAVAGGVLAASVNTTVLPRMSALSSAPEEMSALMRQQALAYVSLFAPVALALVAFPELVVRLLYSDRFLGAAEQLRWQMVGEVLRLPCWIMGSVLVAKSRARACLVLEVSSLVVSVLLVILGARAGGGWLLGVATSIAAIVYFALLSFIVSRDGVVWGRGWLLKGGALLVFFVLGAVVSTWSVWGAGVVSCLALCGGGLALRRIFAGRE
jgi:O-antigen/teichoic acid export membrane protein